jgi:hypothetical protein
MAGGRKHVTPNAARPPRDESAKPPQEAGKAATKPPTVREQVERMEGEGGPPSPSRPGRARGE